MKMNRKGPLVEPCVSPKELLKLASKYCAKMMEFSLINSRYIRTLGYFIYSQFENLFFNMFLCGLNKLKNFSFLVIILDCNNAFGILIFLVFEYSF